MMKKLMLAAVACSVMAWVSSASAQLDNHYLCHQVKPQKGAAKFLPIPDPPGVIVADQVGADKCQVKKPLLLCNPVNKAGSGIPNPDLHYCCYLAKCLQKQQKNYTITDQFGSLKLTTTKPKYLCNPCEKAPS